MKVSRFFFLLLAYLFLVYSYVIYAEHTVDTRVSSEYTFYLLISIVSFGIVFGFQKLKKTNLRFLYFYAILFFWSFAFYINSYKLLNLQIGWPTQELAFLLYIIPILSFVPTIIFPSKINRVEMSINVYKVRLINFFIFLVAIGIAIYEMASTGIVPILMSNISESRLEYGLPFLHVVSEGFLKLSFYMSVYLYIVRNDKVKINKAIIIMTIAYFLITFSRSGLMQVGIFFIIINAINKGEGFLEISPKKTLLAFFLVVSFSVLGGIRQGEEFSINDYTASKVDNQAINWLYGYYFVNLDNLALSVSKDDVSYDYKRSLLFVSQLLGTKPTQTDLNLYSYIGKLNLGTGFRDFSLDWGVYLGGIVLSILIMFYLFLLKLVRSDLSILYQALILTYIALFPMVNRFSGFIPFFVFSVIVFVDFYFVRKGRGK
ncbi:oligosaccharide repeat unit polymerase [Vibrio splendidus]|uniref:oligosaccharide repeat unit polymerase n=1 Tax=Vibrio splendidus TaxID=29497 RepID=UPI0002FD9A67|nr:oligosaccharide repeat unit polymerase [Vibrio splendidus]OEF47203.1 hypothetical protein A150_10440 [Vibrio splendidus 1S-124]PTQ14526.1 oligosaccharide repeat unit polymerase [Vibrio splendidus]